MERNTIQRTLTLEAVRSLKNHPTVDEIYEEIASKAPHIGKGTVYRNLKQLVENGDVSSIEIPGSASHFDHICKKHYHAHCTKCGKVFDVEMPYIPNLKEQIKDSHGFEVEGYDLVFKGLCPNCKETTQNKKASQENS